VNEAGDLLVSDAEREHAASELRTHLEQGRLTLDEFGERLEAAYGARTRSQLDEALRQLPARRPQPPETIEARRPGFGLLAARQAGYSALVIVVCTLVWAFAGGHDYWPRWVILAAAISFVARVGRTALGDEEARTKLERQFGGRSSATLPSGRREEQRTERR
jgi:hypothetical protein